MIALEDDLIMISWQESIKNAKTIKTFLKAQLFEKDLKKKNTEIVLYSKNGQVNIQNALHELSSEQVFSIIDNSIIKLFSLTSIIDAYI